VLTESVGVFGRCGDNARSGPGAVDHSTTRRQPTMRKYAFFALSALLTIVAAFGGDFPTYWP
jgi:hypothetical protein